MEGIHTVITALSYPERVRQVLVCPALLASSSGWEAVAEAYQHPNIDVIEVTEDVFQGLSSKQNPKGLAAVIEQRWSSIEQLQNGGLWVALNSVQYPGNLGTILRTCDAVRASGVILIGNVTDPYHPMSIAASLSGIFSQQVIRADLDAHCRSRTYHCRRCWGW